MSPLEMIIYKDFLPAATMAPSNATTPTGITKKCICCSSLKDLCEFPLTASQRVLLDPGGRKNVCRRCAKVRQTVIAARNARAKIGGWKCLDCGEVSHSTRQNCNGCGLPRE